MHKRNNIDARGPHHIIGDVANELRGRSRGLDVSPNTVASFFERQGKEGRACVMFTSVLCIYGRRIPGPVVQLTNIREDSSKNDLPLARGMKGSHEAGLVHGVDHACTRDYGGVGD